MKRYIFAILAISASLCGCSKQQETIFADRMTVGYEDATKVQLDGSLQAVWNAGDKVGVFFEGVTTAEQWDYVGEDKATTGTIEHKSSVTRDLDITKIALYPYDAAATQSSGQILHTSLPSVQRCEEGSFGATIMCAKETGTSLNFSYATAFVRLKISGFGSIKEMKVQSNAGEAMCGPAIIDMSGSAPVMTLDASASTDYVCIKNDDGSAVATVEGTDKYFFLAIAPITYSDGFTTTITYEGGIEHTVRFTGSVTPAAGKFISLEDEAVCEFELPLDFSASSGTSPKPFTGPDMRSASDFKLLTDGDTSIYDRTYTLTYDGIDYPFTIHAGYFEKTPGNPQYGFYYTTKTIDGVTRKCLLIGRDGAYIHLPKKDGYVLNRLVFIPASTAGTPELLMVYPTQATIESLSRITTETIPGETYELDGSANSDPNCEYALYAHGNFLIYKMWIYYKRI